MTFESDERREFESGGGDRLRVTSNGMLQRWRSGEWIPADPKDYPKTLMARLSTLTNELLAGDYPD